MTTTNSSVENGASATTAAERGALFAEVISTERLSPSMVRVVLGGGELDQFSDAGFTDQYINGQFVPLDAPYAVPFDKETSTADPSFRPRPRRYTVRRWEPDVQQLTIDFVAHGEKGFAGPWAQRAVPGDRLQFKGPGGSYAPDPTADWHLFVGDESALPAIAASLERVQPGAVCVARIVVDGPENELPLDCAGSLDVKWLHRCTAENPELLLADSVAALEFPAGSPDLFVHGEADEVMSVRKHLAVDRGLSVNGASISPYWRRDFTDEQWREVKRSWMAQARADT